MDGETHVVRRGDRRLAGVQTDSHEHAGAFRPLLGCQCALHRHSRGERVPGPREGYEEPVPLRIDLATTVISTRAADQAIVTAQHLRVALAEQAEKACGTLDVGEQERDGPGGQPRHGPWLRPPGTHVKAINRSRRAPGRL